MTAVCHMTEVHRRPEMPKASLRLQRVRGVGSLANICQLFRVPCFLFQSLPSYNSLQRSRQEWRCVQKYVQVFL